MNFQKQSNPPLIIPLKSSKMSPLQCSMKKESKPLPCAAVTPCFKRGFDCSVVPHRAPLPPCPRLPQTQNRRICASYANATKRVCVTWFEMPPELLLAQWNFSIAYTANSSSVALQQNRTEAMWWPWDRHSTWPVPSGARGPCFEDEGPSYVGLTPTKGLDHQEA